MFARIVSLPKKILFALVPAIVLFGVLEIGCLVWEGFDDKVTAFARAAEDLPPKEANEFRLMLYGGSTVVGEPEPTAGFAAQMEAYLKATLPTRTIRIFNYAAAGQPSAYTVRKMHQTLEGSEADAVIVLTAHNEFLFIDDMTEEEMNSLLAIQETMHRSALVRRLRRLVYRYHTARRTELLQGDNLSRFDRSSVRFEERAQLFERNIETVVRLAERAGVPLFLCTGPSNLADWSPAHQKYSPFVDVEGYEPFVDRLNELLGARKWQEAVELAQSEGEPFRDDALVTYAIGKALLGLGETERAREYFYRARDTDTIPFRVISRFNDKLRTMDDPPRVRVVDLERHLNERSPGGVTGFKLVADNCHPTPLGSFHIATHLLDRFHEAGLVTLDGPAEERFVLDAYLEKAGYRAVDYFLANARTAMKAPYLNFRLAEMYLEEAYKEDSENWEVLANVATIMLIKGELEFAEKYFRKAVEVKGSAINIEDTKTVPFLKDALKTRGWQERVTRMNNG